MSDTTAIHKRLAELTKRIAESEDAADVIKMRRDQDKLIDRLASTASGASSR